MIDKNIVKKVKLAMKDHEKGDIFCFLFIKREEIDGKSIEQKTGVVNFHIAALEKEIWDHI